MNPRALAVAALFIVAGCSSGGSAVAPGGTAPPALPPPTAAPVLPAGSASLTLTVPRRVSLAKRAPRYVSPNSAFLVVTVLSVNGAPPSMTQVPAAVNPQTFSLSTAPGGNCTVAPTGETCTVTIAAPTGQVNYQFDLLDASQNKLATNTLTFTIGSGSTQNLQAQLNGIVASVVVFTPTLNAGTSFSGPITVEAFDASGGLIVGAAPYANPFTLTENDASGATSLTNSATTGLVVTVGSPNDVVILNFDGEAIDPFTIAGGIPGKPSQTAGTVQTVNGPVSFPGTAKDTASPSDPNYNQATLAFSSIPSTKPFTAAEVGWSDQLAKPRGFTVALDPATCGSGAAAVVTVSAAPGTTNRTFNVTSQHHGLCKATLTGGPPSHASTGVIWFSVP